MMKTVESERFQYASFWQRAFAAVADAAVLMPIAIVIVIFTSRFRLFRAYFLIPWTIFLFWFHVYLVQRYGGTPGKLIAKIRVRNLDGSPVGYKAALLRASVEIVLGFIMSSALAYVMYEMTDAEFLALTRTTGIGAISAKAMRQMEPTWYTGLEWVSQIWFWSELVVMLTNRMRRAPHDFIASTVVLKNTITL